MISIFIIAPCVQEQRPSGALLLPGCRVEERELGKEEKEEEEEMAKYNKEEMAKYNKEEMAKYNKEEGLRRSEDQTTCLVVVRPDGSSLLLRAEVIISCPFCNLPVFINTFFICFSKTYLLHTYYSSQVLSWRNGRRL